MRKLPVRTSLLLLLTLFLPFPTAAETEQVPTVPCCHNWQEVYHPEEGHEEIVCGCRCNSNAEWGTYV